MKHNIAPILCATLLVAGCSTVNSSGHKETSSSLDAKAQISAAVGKVATYWHSRIAGMPNFDVQYLYPTDTDSCSGLFDYPKTEERGSDVSAVYYCQGKNHIGISAAGMNQANLSADDVNIPPQYAVDYIIGHEYGHGVQDYLGILVKARSPSKELQADCLSGQAMKAYNPTEATVMADHFRRFIGDFAPDPIFMGRNIGNHGTPAERQAAFSKGVEGQNCFTAYSLH